MEFSKMEKYIHKPNQMETAELEVNYDLNIQEMIDAGHYDHVELYPTTSFKQMGMVVVEVKLFHFDRYISSKEAVREIRKAGFRSAKMEELLAFGAKLDSELLEFPITALGSGFFYSKNLYVLGIERHSSAYWLNGHWFGETWEEEMRFLAVKPKRSK